MKCIQFMYGFFSRLPRYWAYDLRLQFSARTSSEGRAAGEPPPRLGGAAEDGEPNPSCAENEDVLD